MGPPKFHLLPTKAYHDSQHRPCEVTDREEVHPGPGARSVWCSWCLPAAPTVGIAPLLSSVLEWGLSTTRSQHSQQGAAGGPSRTYLRGDRTSSFRRGHGGTGAQPTAPWGLGAGPAFQPACLPATSIPGPVATAVCAWAALIPTAAGLRVRHFISSCSVICTIFQM